MDRLVLPFMAGLDFAACACSHEKSTASAGSRPFQPAVIPGMNAIAIHLASELGAALIEGAERIYRGIFALLASPADRSLLNSLALTAIMYRIAYIIYRQRRFSRVES